jgi:hypothetical protein
MRRTYCLLRTVQLRLSRVASMLPAASVALTEKVWEPTASLMYCLGEEHALKAPPSSLHWKVEFASLEEKVNEALFCFMVPEGPNCIVVSGGVVSGGQLTPSGNLIGSCIRGS